MEFILQISTFNLAQYGQIFYENQAHKVNVPKMDKCFTTIVGQSDWSLHCLSCLTYGQSRRHRGIWWSNPPQTMHQAPQIEIWKLYLVV